MIIAMRGVPGSGKSYHAEKLVEELRFKHSVKCSADSFFMDKDGNYNFNPALLAQAHGACLRRYIEAVLAGHASTAIVVDNTNSSVEELAPYVAVASAYGHPFKLVTVLAEPLKAHARNTHGVPLHAVLRMDEAIRTGRLPPYWNIETLTIEN